MDKTAAYIISIVSIAAIVLAGAQSDGSGIHSEVDDSRFEHHLTIMSDQGIDTWKTYNYPKVTAHCSVTDSRLSFEGWFDESGNFLSSSSTYDLTLTRDVTIYAGTYGDVGVPATVQQVLVTPDKVRGATELTDHYSGKKYSISSSGTWIPASKYDYPTKILWIFDSSDSLVVDGTVQKTFAWSYKGKHYEFTYSSTFKKIAPYLESPKGGGSSCEYKAATISTGGLEPISSKLKSYCTGFSDWDRANFILRFVQSCTSYMFDDRFHATETDYWKAPLLTLLNAAGDCEDSSLAACALFKAAGLDSIFVLYDHDVSGEPKGHAIAAVALSVGPADGDYFSKYGKRFYYCETTNNHTDVGTSVGYFSPTNPPYSITRA